MIVVIQCAATKRAGAGLLRRQDGTKVLFVADPAAAPPSSELVYARPDDTSDTNMTWREALLQYNRSPDANPLGLYSAAELYANPTYGLLAKRFGTDRTYILSAGWGLIGASLLTPYYDITFSTAAERYKRRRKGDSYSDFRLPPTASQEPIVFFGGKDYVPLFCELTKEAKVGRTVFYNSHRAPEAPGCLLERFVTTTRTNWHYECATQFAVRGLKGPVT
jgi:hypothetical protein